VGEAAVLFKKTLAVTLLIVVMTASLSARCRLNSAREGASQATMAEEMVAAHNAVRARMGLRPLAWSQKAADYAQQWADYLLASGEFKHRTEHRYGENLYEIVGGSATASEVVREWSSEAAQYDYRSNVCLSGQCGHYTQVVWHDSTKVGCAVARDKLREVWVCSYDPPGNYIGERPY
jgi:uncharacterized protein YkwD